MYDSVMSMKPKDSGASSPHILRPASVHIGLAMAEYKLNAERCGVPADVLTEMLRGMQRYQDHDFRRPDPGYQTFWQKGQVRLLRHTGQAEGRAIVLIPSMINRSAILDLLPSSSFMRFLAQHGYAPILLDWGQPTEDPGQGNIEQIVRARLLPALEVVVQQTGAPVDVLGYCMGGLLMAAGLSLRPEIVRKAVFLASPWDFHAGDRRMLSAVAAGTPAAMQIMAAKGTLPMAWIQSVFAAVNADRTAEKFAGFANMAQDSDEARLFVAVEDWLNDGVDLPAGLAKAAINEWYGENRPASGLWTIDGRVIDLSVWTGPALIVASRRDRLVPAESSLAMKKHLPNADLMQPDCGHIGMMTGRHAQSGLWGLVASWLNS